MMFKGGKIPDYDYITLDPDVFKAVEITDYTPPIDLITSNMETKLEDGVYSAVTKAGVQVNKEELIKALENDRNQYELGFRIGYSKGYEEGYEEGKTYYEKDEFFGIVEDLYNKLKELRDKDDD